MKRTWPILIGELLISFIISLVSNPTMDHDFFTLMGLCNLLIGLFSFFVALVITFFDRELAKPVFLASGIVLLVGGLTCSIFPWGYNNAR